MSLYIGLMSGTSMDGIDAALMEMPSNRLIFGLTKKYTPLVHKKLNDLVNGINISLANICELNTLIGREFAAAVNELLEKTGVNCKDIEAIGSHGQTVCHDTNGPIPYTLQLGCAHTISSLTQITVVADFRTRDVVNGGQGAPFAPLYHQEVFAHANESVAVVNIGGISNISLLDSEGKTTGWDIGPGNCLMDAWINWHHNKPFDRNGEWAEQGVVIDDLLQQLLLDPFLNLKPPKSIGKEYYSLTWLESYLNKSWRPVDIQATLLALTASSIAQSIVNLKNDSLKKLYLCGGGTHNRQLYNTLASLLPHVEVHSSASVGVDPDYLEAMMFAWFAQRALEKIPVDLSAITGSKKRQLLGAIYPFNSKI